MKNQILWQPYPGGRMMVYFCWDLCLQVFWKYHMTEAMCSQLEWVRFVAQKNMSKIYETQSWIVDLLSRTRFRKQLTPLPNYCVHTHKLSLSLSHSPSSSSPPRDLKHGSSHIWQAGDAGDGGVWPNVRPLPPWAIFCECVCVCVCARAWLWPQLANGFQYKELRRSSRHWLPLNRLAAITEWLLND